MTQSPAKTSTIPNPNHRLVRLWLVAMAGLIAALVLVGGATRLTDSGLSITQWRPVLGVIPPLDEADWQAAFARYRAIPEYKLINQGMGLDAFKRIFWWEWSHRFLARFVGLAFLLPLIWFWARGHLSRPLARVLAFVFVLGGLQGVLGWYMVKSGLVDRVDVSQYRLAAHLGLAVLLFGAITWLALGLERRTGPRTQPYPWGGVTAIVLVGLIFVQILFGAFVAGLDAGKGYNTWPLIDGSVIPQNLFAMTPKWRNVFENALTVQFIHRNVAYLIVLVSILHALDQWRIGNKGWATSALLSLVVVGQAALGIAALLGAAPVNLSLLHQAGSLVLFAVAIWHLHIMVHLS